MMVRGAPWVSLAVAALGFAVTVQGCALIAGLQPHTLDAGAGGATSASTGSAGGAVSAGGHGGTGGAGPVTPGWPDSSTAYCTDGVAQVPCPSAAGSMFHGQDGDVRVDVPVYVTTPKLVTDLRTGLMWRRAPLPPQSQQQASDVCTGQDYQGYSGWRLPSRLELVSVLDYGALGARIDHDAFPDVKALPLWSGTTFAMAPPGSEVWGVDLGCSLACMPTMGGSGSTGGLYPGNPLPALCVRGAPLVTGDFGPAMNGAVTDASTGLTWTVEVSPAGTSWADALAYCRDMLSAEELGGFSDWRLPSIKELQTIVDDTAKSGSGLYPALHTVQEDYLWSSTPDTDALSPIRIHVMLTGGDATTLSIAEAYAHTRCVRGP
jgi:hypothetical protein